jgi:Tat protein secretion system quality control protein TatD with DNase activity
MATVGDRGTGENPFPWELGVFDAHCHPTDNMASIADIPRMKTATLTIMATRGEDQDLVCQVASQLGTGIDSDHIGRVIPSFGWHPWFSHQILDPQNDDSASGVPPKDAKLAHYKSVLIPSPEDEMFIQSLPDPKPLSVLIEETRTRLVANPVALVGEIGLDKAFRLPGAWLPDEIGTRNASLTPGSREGRRLSPYRVRLDHQKAVLKAQLRLAGKLHRAVSIHSVQAHGTVLELLQELWVGHEREVLSHRERRRRRSVAGAYDTSDIDEENQDEPARPASRVFRSFPESRPALPFPPRICMHSYSGPAEPLRQFLRQSVPSDVYFSFSSVINFSNASSEKVIEVIKVLPADRLLVESDFHCAGPQMDDRLEEVTRRVCLLRGWTLEEGVRQLAENWKHFVFG